MSWFTRKEKGIVTPTELKKEAPDGLWYQCPECKKVMHTREHRKNLNTCTGCNHHARIGSEEYFEILFDDNQFYELNERLVSGDPLGFKDTKAYPDRIVDAWKKSGLKDAMRTAVGSMEGQQVVIACMDFGFIGGSMGSVVGEKFARAVDYALTHGLPYICISKSGGARMMEAGYSLMQMAKTSAKLAQLDRAGLPYISVMTDPTTGGVTASYAMLGDFNVAEPGSLIGFAGPRVIRETIGKELPEGFQTAEFLLEHGFLDFIVHRKDMKQRLSDVIKMVMHSRTKQA